MKKYLSIGLSIFGMVALLFILLIVLQITVADPNQENVCNELKQNNFNAYIVDTGLFVNGLVCYVEIDGYKFKGSTIKNDLLNSGGQSNE